jgi:lysophospholipid acyltransferase (LPLAT)-like uncharacterized protein
VPRNEAAKITLLQHTVTFIGGVLVKLLAWTLRVKWVDDAGFYDPARRRPLILCVWHNRVPPSIICDYRARQRRVAPLSVLTSASKDGGWAEAVARRFRMHAIRGSSSRRGAAALVGLVRHIRAGGDIVITPDGPRGPNYKIAPGLLYLAQRTGAGIVPVEVHLSRYWSVGKRWEALRIPKPFSKVTMTYHVPITITASEDEFAAETARLDAAMGAK